MGARVEEGWGNCALVVGEAIDLLTLQLFAPNCDVYPNLDEFAKYTSMIMIMLKNFQVYKTM